MRKLILSMYTTLDGFYDIDDFEPGEEEHRYANALFDAADAVLFGRQAYQDFVGYWDTLDTTDPAVPEVEREFATLFRNKPRVVFSRTLDHADANAVLIRDGIAEEVARLKEQRGSHLLLVCGSELLPSFVDLGLIDEYQILVRPTVLGHGRSLFGKVQQPLRLKLVETRAFSSGVVMHVYRPG